MKNNLNKSLLQYGFLILLIGVTTSMVFKTLDVSLLSNVMNMVDKKYLFIGMFAILVNIALEGLVLRILIDGTHKVNVRLRGLKLATIGFYYNLVTPFASGSQPMQIYILTKYKMPLSKASAIITNKSILYQLVVTFYCSTLILFNFDIIRTQLSSVIPLVVLGIAMNLFTILMAFLVILNPSKVKQIFNIFANFICKFKLFKRFESKIDGVGNFIDEYSESIQFFIKNKKLMISSILLTVVQISFYFSISFWIYKAFNLEGHTYLNILTLQVLLYMAISPIPTPGNVGANELAFFTIFKGVFPSYLMGYAVFLYGGFMYYLILIGSGIFTVITHHRLKVKDSVKQNLVTSK
ncbi:MAG: lysylphosphatidylglycerol synthase transmembrane domain-containing protein [Peptostreptococcaceae bacterium]